jgi:hypothetical protein
MVKKWGVASLVLTAVAGILMLFTLFLTGGGVAEINSGEEIRPVAKNGKPKELKIGNNWSDDAGGGVTGGGSSKGDLDEVGWGMQMFPDFIQVPNEVGDLVILACEELLLSNGRILRVTSCRRDEEPEALLIVELGNGFGGVERRGIFDPSKVKIEHAEESNGRVFQRIHKAGWGGLASSSLDDRKIFIRAPVDPMRVIEFLSSIQNHVGDDGTAGLIPAADGWGDLRPAHGDRFVRLARVAGVDSRDH